MTPPINSVIVWKTGYVVNNGFGTDFGGGGSAGNPMPNDSGSSASNSAEGESGDLEGLDNIASKLDEVINKIPSKFKVNGKCNQFAESLAKKLDDIGIEYEIIRVDSSSLVYSNKTGDIIGSGFHYGIKVGDNVYDNLTLGGMSYDAWKADLGIGEVAGIKCGPASKILNR